jgi:Holliday junction DNA helicase RuvA
MLGYIQGIILSKSPESNHCVVLAGDVGYEVLMPKNLYDGLVVNAPTKLWIYTHVREDQITLFGFTLESEKVFFRQLLGVSGLGPKGALSLLGEHGVEKLVHYVITKQSSMIAEAPGIGKKLAERLILELSGKIEKWTWVGSLPKLAKTSPEVGKIVPTSVRDDLSSALMHLGYQPNHVKMTLDKLFAEDSFERQGFENCLKSALKEMSGRTKALRGGNVIGNG